MQVPATQLKVGTVIKYQNDLCRVSQVTHITPGNWRGMASDATTRRLSGSSMTVSLLPGTIT